MGAGRIDLVVAFDPISWHAHEFLFGYLGAVLAGFLLTAVPNWTGRSPIIGWPLILLAGLWGLGRAVIFFGAEMPPGVVAAIDLLFPVALILVIGNEILKGRNWRNLIIVAMVFVLAVSNALFHWEAATGNFAPHGFGFRLGLSAALMMIAVIGGRVVPSFTRNWLASQGADSLPAAPMGRLDRISLLVLLAALILWVAVPEHVLTGGLLFGAGVIHFVRLARWRGVATISEPLVLILHVAYAFVPLGAIAMATAVLFPDLMHIADAQHLWMAGGIGIMTLAIMTRATLGHTGQDLTADLWTVLIYSLVIGAIMLRTLSGWLPFEIPYMNSFAGLAWILGFGCFLLRYGPILVGRSLK